MVEFLAFLWLISTINIFIFGIKWLIEKRKKQSKNKEKQMKKILLISLAISILSFLGVGLTAPEVSQNNSNSQIINEANALVQEFGNIEEENEEEQIHDAGSKVETSNQEVKLENIPTYTGNPYVAINENNPFFDDVELTATSFEKYSDLDELGRCGVAIANIGKDIMPTEERGEIGSVKPTGWHTVKYDNVSGKYLYNRCHLIGYQLSGENENTKNLITGTRYLNVEGMLPFENMIADYVTETENHVLYRVTPIFEGNNLLASGVLLEAKSVEDNGAGILFNVYCYNVQPEIKIDYATGDSWSEATTLDEVNSVSEETVDSVKEETNSSTSENTENNKESVKEEKSQTYILNTSTKKFHYESCGSAKLISEKNKSTFIGSRDKLISQGYSPCGNCDP